jgi:predicted RNA-binding Zn-ribbon protein involved in translation (DUF1610 family)
MAYKCPRCGSDVQRGTSSSAQVAAGLIGALFYAAFGAFQCKKCGKIEKHEFPAEDRSKMAVGSTVMVIGAIILAVALIAFLVYMNRL